MTAEGTQASRPMRTSPLRIGLLVDSATSQNMCNDFVTWAQTQNNVLAVTHLVLHPREASAGKSNNLLNKLITALKKEGISGTFSRALSKRII